MGAFAKNKELEGIQMQFKVRYCLKFLYHWQYGSNNLHELAKKHNVAYDTMIKTINKWLHDPLIVDEIIKRKRGDLMVFSKDNDQRSFTERYQAEMMKTQRNQILTE